MAKNLKLNIKNEQIAKSLNLSSVKKKLAKKKPSDSEEGESKKKEEAQKKAEEAKAAEAENTAIVDKPQRRVRARSKSAFDKEEEATEEPQEEAAQPEPEPEAIPEPVAEEAAEVVEEKVEAAAEPEPVEPEAAAPVVEEAPAVEEVKAEEKPEPTPEPEAKPAPEPEPKPRAVLQKRREANRAPYRDMKKPEPRQQQRDPAKPRKPKLGPTGRHINDILPPKPKKPAPGKGSDSKPQGRQQNVPPKESDSARTNKPKPAAAGKKQYRDLKPARRLGGPSQKFDARDRQGLRAGEEERWRKRRPKKQRTAAEIEEMTVRPKELTVRLPISIKDLAAEMKLKASQLIQKLFMQGVVVTLNDVLDDETTVQLLGEEFECAITIDTSEEERVRITGKSIREEIADADEGRLALRPPVITFMGHVDHGKTSLIDAIRSSNLTAGEAGAITQHIGAFKVCTDQGDIAILDTPGHEAFSAMRARGAEVTDIVVLVVAGDEGMRQQTEEALQHAKAAGVTIVVAINKCDKDGFNEETVYRQMAEYELTPECWGGTVATINTSAVTREGVDELLEMLVLQAEVLELKADPDARARGTVLESEMCKGRGNVATLLVQNGTLQKGDAVVFGQSWGRVKTMHNDQGKAISKAGPCTPVEITGLSDLPEAGEEFIVVADEKEAKTIAEIRAAEAKKKAQMKRAATGTSLESLLQQSEESEKKVLNVILRADVQGSCEALKTALLKIESTKAEVNVIFHGVGEVSESDVQLAAASNAMIIGFHTQVEAHAEQLIKETGVQVKTHDIIYHAVDEVKLVLRDLLDEIPEEEDRGAAEVRATFKSSAVGVIAGCYVTEGTIARTHYARLIRDGKQIWQGKLDSLKRHNDDAKEVNKGFECGIVLAGKKDVQEGDIIKTYEIVYYKQDL